MPKEFLKEIIKPKKKAQRILNEFTENIMVGKSQNLTEEVSRVFKGIVYENFKGIFDEIYEEITEEKPTKDLPHSRGEFTKGLQKNFSRELPEDTSKKLPKHSPKQLVKKISKKLPENLRKNTTRISKKIPDDCQSHCRLNFLCYPCVIHVKR